jgi:hypothetical protein
MPKQEDGGAASLEMIEIVFNAHGALTKKAIFCY